MLDYLCASNLSKRRTRTHLLVVNSFLCFIAQFRFMLSFVVFESLKGAILVFPLGKPNVRNLESIAAFKMCTYDPEIVFSLFFRRGVTTNNKPMQNHYWFADCSFV